MAATRSRVAGTDRIIRPPYFSDNMAALDVAFASGELAELERAFAPGTIVGERYPEFVLRWAAR